MSSKEEYDTVVTMLKAFRAMLDLYEVTGDKQALEAVKAGIKAALDKAEEMSK